MDTINTQRSHRNLGPVIHNDDVMRDAKSQRINRGQPGDGYHHFAGLFSARKGLDAETLENLCHLLQDKLASSAPEAGFLNAPQSNGPLKSRGIPAGYTYLFQLAAHDVVQTSIPAKPFGAPAQRPRNLRREPLEMETILGGGPISCPHAFDLAAPGAAKLRLGYVRKDASFPLTWIPPARDLPRISFQPDGLPDPRDGLETVLVADDRNDDNLLLSQLTVFFHGLYNYLVCAIDAQESMTATQAEDTARRILIRVYRRILRHDLLARILHPDIYTLYLNQKIRLDTLSAEGSTSLEFAFAAGRLGHSMVRDMYRLNARSGGDQSLETAIRTSSRHAPKWVPIEHGDIVDWDMFFEPENGRVPDGFNWALRFGPQVVGTMTTPLAAASPEGTKFFVRETHGTVFRDLTREASGAMIKVSDLVEHALTTQPASAWGTALDNVISNEKRRKIVETGLARLESKVTNTSHVHLNKTQREAILSDPPLSLFMMFEADQLGHGGATLGPVGSLVIGEAMWPAFYPKDWESPHHDLAKLEAALLGCLPETMPQLIGALKTRALDIFAT